MKGAHVTLRNFGMGVASSLIAAGFGLWITEPKHWISALVIAGAGVAAFVATYLLTKKPAPPATPSTVHQDVKQEVSPQVTINPQFNPQFNPSIQIGVAHPTEADHRRIESLVMEFLKQYRKLDRSFPQPLSVIVEGVRRSDPQLTELDIVEALNSLCTKKLIVRRPMEIEGGYVYWLL
jgi:hypothetical protein